MVERLVVMDSVTTKFGKPSTISVSKSFIILLLFLFVACLVATGFLVYNLSACSKNTQVETQTKALVCDTVSATSTEQTRTTSTTSTTQQPSTTSVTTEASKKTEKNVNLRLPKSVLPESYDLKLIPFIQEGNFTFHGDVSIVVKVVEKCRNITLHSDELKIQKVQVFNQDSRTVQVASFRNEKERQFLIIDLEEDILPQQKYWIYITFEGVLNDLMQGFYRSSYVENNQTRWIAATQFQPTDARKAFPCFDEPALKARFLISIARLKNMTSVSNMRQTSHSNSVKNLPDYVWDKYEESLPMSTYLLAFMVTDFKSISNGTFSIWARPSALSQAKYSLKIGPQILKYYEEFFGIKYPLPKLDMAAIPDFPSGAMENWGLITYREPVLLYEEYVSSRSNLQRIAHVVAHELAHQWFGNLVTPTWWSDLWLNEGFATYVEFLGANAVAPEWKDRDLFLVSELHGSLSLDALQSSHQISIEVNNPNEVNEIFDRISYSKGASIIRMMQQFLSEQVFHTAINKYLNSRIYSNAEQDDLWQALTDESHSSKILEDNVTVKEIMDTWTLQTGFPVITALRNYDDNSVDLTQKRFLVGNPNHTIDVLWWVPVTYTDSTQNQYKLWMRKEQHVLLKDLPTKPNDWLLLNVNQSGYYRVNYDERNWKMIIAQLTKKNGHLAFDPKNRAQIMDDVLNLAYSGYVSYETALNATLYLYQEREYVPWKAALNNLNYMYSMFERSSHFDKYKKYMLQLIEPFYSEVGFKDLEDPLLMLSQSEILSLACELGLRDCVIKAVQLFQNWKNSANPDMDNIIPPDLRELIYCTAISDGGQEEWDFAWQRYLNTNVANEKEILLSALGCSKEVWLLSRYLEWTLTENSGIRKHDAAGVFAAVSNNPIGQDLTYRFMKTNWDRIRSYLGSSTMFLSIIVRTSTSHFNTEIELNDFKTFFNCKYDEFGVALRSAQQAIEECEANVKWMKKYFNLVVQWLTKATA